MIRQKSVGERIFGVFNVVILTLLCIITIYPLYFVVVASFTNPADIYASKGLLLYPKNPTIEGYLQVFKNDSLLTGYRNTIFYVVVGTGINLVMTCLGAYVLSRKNLMFSKAITVMIVFTMYFGGGLIPLFMTVKNLGILYTRWAVLLPSALSTYNMIIMRTSFQGIPSELQESAKIDGASDMKILVRIILPLSIPVIAVLGLFYGVGWWNSWFNETIFLNDRSMYPLQVILREILLLNTQVDYMKLVSVTVMDSMAVRELVKYSIIVVGTVPILFVYPFLQKYFVKGVMVGSLKG